MPDSHLYKTKLCVLYQRGGCNRQSCSFAHGDEELRNRPAGRYYRDRSFNRRSPGSRFGRRIYDREASRSWSPNNTRGLSKSPSPSSPGQKRSGSNIEKEDEVKKPKVEHQSDLSDSRPQGEAQSDVQSSKILAEKLQKAEADLELFDKHKIRMENSLERASEEKQSLLSRVKDYEDRIVDLNAINQRLQRFQKAYFEVLHCQEDLRRAESLLQRLADEDYEDYRRRAYDASYEEDQSRWKSRASDGPAANGIDGKHRKLEYDDLDVTDNASERRNLGAF